MNTRNIFTSVMIMAVFALSLGIATPTHAAITYGSLLKASTSAVFYYANNGKRYVFPNFNSYKTWYPDFSGVQQISDAEMAGFPIGGNVTYRPGTQLIKLGTSSTVYAVSKGGVLRPLINEATATCVYGSNWNSLIDIMPDTFFVNYTIGSMIAACSDYSQSAELSNTTTINQNLGL